MTYNPYISNGTCYTAAGQELGSEFVPCGNAAFGPQTCCGAGDNCLADNACFGFHGSGVGSYLTYLAGCTDESYTDGTCPKKDLDQPWVGLTLCDNSNGAWAICSQAGAPSTLEAGSYCSCTNAASATLAFSDSNTLSNICSLPQSIGQSIQFFVGHFPSTVLASSSHAASPTSTQASASGSSGPSQNSASPTAGTSGSSPAASSSAVATSAQASTTASSAEASSVTVFTSSSVAVFTSSGSTITSTVPLTTSSTVAAGGSNGGSTHGLSSAAKAGIGVGAGLGAVILLGLLIALLLFRRRRQSPKRQRSVRSQPMGADYDYGSKLAKKHRSDEPPMSAASTAPPFYDPNEQTMQEAEGRAATPWTLRNELEGSQPHAIAELPGSERYPGEQGVPNRLNLEADRQNGPDWKAGSSSKVLNAGGGMEYLHANPSPSTTGADTMTSSAFRDSKVSSVTPELDVGTWMQSQPPQSRTPDPAFDPQTSGLAHSSPYGNMSNTAQSGPAALRLTPAAQHRVRNIFR